MKFSSQKFCNFTPDVSNLHKINSLVLKLSLCLREYHNNMWKTEEEGEPDMEQRKWERPRVGVVPYQALALLQFLVHKYSRGWSLKKGREEEPGNEASTLITVSYLQMNH